MLTHIQQHWYLQSKSGFYGFKSVEDCAEARECKRTQGSDGSGGRSHNPSPCVRQAKTMSSSWSHQWVRWKPQRDILCITCCGNPTEIKGPFVRRFGVLWIRAVCVSSVGLRNKAFQDCVYVCLNLVTYLTGYFMEQMVTTMVFIWPSVRIVESPTWNYQVVFPWPPSSYSPDAGSASPAHESLHHPHPVALSSHALPKVTS